MAGKLSRTLDRRIGSSIIYAVKVFKYIRHSQKICQVSRAGVSKRENKLRNKGERH